jgi:hypothetical protein
MLKNCPKFKTCCLAKQIRAMKIEDEERNNNCFWLIKKGEIRCEIYQVYL